MISFILLSPLMRSFFYLWGYLLCFLGIVSVIQTIHGKKDCTVYLSSVLFLISFMFVQCNYDIHLYVQFGKASSFSLFVGNFPVYYWGFLYLCITVGFIYIQVRISRYSKENITLSSIKLCADSIPCGICYWNDNGRIIFSNSCINQLCVQITGAPLLNGLNFRQEISNGVMKINNKVWNVSEKEVFYNGEILHELIVTDVSEIYKKTMVLQNNNEILSNMTKELREFSLNIDDIVRREEILRAKINIHDEMNRLVLTTEAVDLNDEQILDSILSMWERNALLFCMEADSVLYDDALDRLEKFAKALGIQLTWKEFSLVSLSNIQKELFFITAREALANVSKHTDAHLLKIVKEETKEYIKYSFENEGGVTGIVAKTSGGLSNLDRLAKKQDAIIQASIQDKKFILLLIFKK